MSTDRQEWYYFYDGLYEQKVRSPIGRGWDSLDRNGRTYTARIHKNVR